MTKLNFLFILACLSLLMACSKNEGESKYDGTWKLDKTSGGITGQGLTTDWNKIKIAENVCTFYKDASNLAVADLSYTHTDLCHSVKITFKSEDARVLDIRTDNIKCISVNENKLELTSECCDRYNYSFIKE